MGAIARNAANKITTGGVFTSGAITNDSVTGITVLANAADGITLISSQTASASASISFTTGITSTYKAYKFVFVNIHPSTAGQLKCNFSTDSGSNYNVTKTTTSFVAVHNEADTETNLVYQTARDLAQSTSDMWVSSTLSSDNDSNWGGTMILFNPSSTTYVKHFLIRGNSMQSDPASYDDFFAGYANTTSAINAVRFQMSSGNIDAGTIYLYGIK
jgi:hypothetical protein